MPRLWESNSSVYSSKAAITVDVQCKLDVIMSRLVNIANLL